MTTLLKKDVPLATSVGVEEDACIRGSLILSLTTGPEDGRIRQAPPRSKGPRAVTGAKKVPDWGRSSLEGLK